MGAGCPEQRDPLTTVRSGGSFRKARNVVASRLGVHWPMPRLTAANILVVRSTCSRECVRGRVELGQQQRVIEVCRDERASGTDPGTGLKCCLTTPLAVTKVQTERP